MPDNVNRILTLYLPDEDAVVVEKAYGFGGGVDHLDESDMLSINGHSWRCESDMDDWLDSFWNLYGAGHGPNSNFMEQFSKYLHDCLPFGYGPSNKMADWMMIVAKKLKDYEKLKREHDPETTLSKIWTNGKASLYIEETPI